MYTRATTRKDPDGRLTHVLNISIVPTCPGGVAHCVHTEQGRWHLSTTNISSPVTSEKIRPPIFTGLVFRPSGGEAEINALTLTVL